MKYALVIIEVDISDTNTLKGVSESLQSFQIQHEFLNAGSYMLPLKDGLTSLRKILSELETRKLSSRVLFFDSDPAWVYSDPTQKTK